MQNKAYLVENENEQGGRIEASKGQEYEYEESLPDEQDIQTLDITKIIDEPNVADILDEASLSAIARDTISSYEADKASRSHREKSMDEAMNMALQVTQEKDFPWAGASNVIYPLITEASITFAARAYPAIVRSDKIVHGIVFGSDDGLPQPMTDPMTGQPFIDPETGQPVTQMVGAGEKKARAERVADYMNYQLFEEIEGWEEDTDKMLSALPIVGNMFRKIYYNKDLGRPEATLVYPRHLIVNYKAKSLERAPRITEEVELYPYEIIERIRSGLYLDFNFGSASNDDEALSERDEMSELQGDFDNPHLFLQQYRKIDLDGDGYPEPYIVTVHLDTQTVVRIKANYHKDGIEYNKDKEISKIKCEEYYIKYGFLPSLDGSFYDLGLGELLLTLNKSINGILNRLLDAGTLANTSQGFLARGVKIKGGDSPFRPGQFKTADTRGMALKESFVQIQHPEPSMVLFQLLGLIIESAKGLGSLQKVLEGEPMANQSGIAALTMIEQGLTSFKSIYKRVYRSLKKELKLLYRINSVYLKEDEYFRVMDNNKAVARADFNTEDIDVTPAADPTIATDMQRMAKAQFLMSFMQDPNIDQKGLRERIFDYMGEDGNELIVDAPPTPEDPNVALVKGQIEVEQYKAQIKEQEAQMKMQKEMAGFQLDQQKAALQSDIDMQDQEMKQREGEFKLQQLMMELELKRAENMMKADKTEAEKQKIQMQTHEIMAKIAIAEQQACNQAHEKREKDEKEKDSMTEVKEVLAAVATKDDTNKAIADAIKSLDHGKKQIKITKDKEGNISGSIS